MLSLEAATIEQRAQSAEAAPAFDLNTIALSQNFADMADVKTESAAPAIAKPGKQIWFTPHPEQASWRSFLILNDETDHGVNYVIAPTLKDALVGDCVAKVLIPCQTLQGLISFWPIRLPNADGKFDSWNQSALEIATSNVNQWIRVKSNMEAKAYEAVKPVTPRAAPVWPEDIDALYRKAVGAVFIDSLSHPILKRLRGEI